MSKVIGYLNCKGCRSYTHLTNPKDIKIFYHPDDASTVQVVCKACGAINSSKITWDHARNFMIHGVKVYSLGDQFDKLVEADIDNWDIDSELEGFFDA